MNIAQMAPKNNRSHSPRIADSFYSEDTLNAEKRGAIKAIPLYFERMFHVHILNWCIVEANQRAKMDNISKMA
ncbi:MAG: hypothetical protein HQM08_16460 [Candidatus Riflebacteria bacterium]|nr:hypothetical protein [Candidatus Riflebacteria bacterium]